MPRTVHVDSTANIRAFNACEAASAAIALLDGKWKIHILCAMRLGPVRLGELTRTIPNASKKSITQSLRELEKAKLVYRTDLSGRRLHVEYRLVEHHEYSLQSLLDHLAAFADSLSAVGSQETESTRNTASEEGPD